MLQGGNGRFVLQALPKTMNIKLDKRSQALLKEMLRKKLSLWILDVMLKEAVEMLHASEKKTGFT